MLPMSTDKEWLLKQAAEDEGCVSVGGLYVRIEREEAKQKAAARIAFTKLVELQSRSLRLTLEALAARAQIDVGELVALARGELAVPEAQTVRRLARALSLPEERLLALAGHGEPSETSIQEAAVRFAARSEPVRQLSTEESAALQEFVQALGTQ